MDFEFQSALAPKDERYTTHHRSFNPLSPRKDERYVDPTSGFQSALAPKDERYRHDADMIYCDGSLRFNPLSPRRTRDTFCRHHKGFNRPEGREIQWASGRSGFNPLSPRRTRDTGPRGDFGGRIFRFNPLSPRRTRDTLLGRSDGFNPLSPRRTRDTIPHL